MMQETRLGAFLRSDRALALLLAALGLAGLVHIEIGQWRPGPGGGNDLMPWLAYWAMLLAAVPILLWPGQPSEAALRPLWPMLVALGGAALYFVGVRHLGLAVSSAAFTAFLGAMLTDWRVQGWKALPVLAIVAGIGLWLLFTHVAPIITRSPLLF